MKQFYKITGVVIVEASDDDTALAIVEETMSNAHLKYKWLYTNTLEGESNE